MGKKIDLYNENCEDTMKIHNENWAIGKPFWNIKNQKNPQGFTHYVNGEYHYKNGTVIIYQQGYLHDNKFATFSIYRNGRGYYRTIRGKLFTHIGLARKAGKFAREIDSACA